MVRGFALLLVFAALFLLIFGLQKGYFPAAASWWLAIPFGLLGFLPAVLFNRSVEDAPAPRRGGRHSPWVVFLLLPPLVAAGFSVGAPSLLLSLLGPDKQVTARIVGREERASRSCRFQVVVARYSHARDAKFCVSRQEFDRLKAVRQVVIPSRESYFGTLGFSIRPADEGPE
jgi:hypothetical protein